MLSPSLLETLVHNLYNIVSPLFEKHRVCYRYATHIRKGPQKKERAFVSFLAFMIEVLLGRL